MYESTQKKWQTSRFRIDLSTPQIMGIVNVTPDSFSDGGQNGSTVAALRHCEQLIQDGADLLDIGGESTRPGATPLSLSEELARLLPVVRATPSKCLDASSVSAASMRYSLYLKDVLPTLTDNMCMVVLPAALSLHHTRPGVCVSIPCVRVDKLGRIYTSQQGGIVWSVYSPLLLPYSALPAT